MKIKKVQKKIAKYTKKLEKYLDLLAELTAAKEIVAEAALEKAELAVEKPVEAPIAEPALVKTIPAESAPVEATPVEQPKPTRRRRAASTRKSSAKATPVEQPKPTRKRRAPAEQPSKRTPARRLERASFVLYNCDEEKSPESKYNRNDETFKDSQLGRRGLWNKLKTEIAEGRIELLDNYPVRNVRLDIQSGDPVSVSQHLKYGLIEKV